jgi:hypothetical protein
MQHHATFAAIAQSERAGPAVGANPLRSPGKKKRCINDI